jgi:uncharacterized protein (DUF1810 family)
MEKQFDLERFKLKQAEDGHGYLNAKEELENGQKTGHWIWYIFPQLKGLGKSHFSEYYGLESIDEAVAYLKDETLSERLVSLVEILLDEKQTKTALEIFGYTDAMKFRSCLTLFQAAVESNPELLTRKEFECFGRGLRRYY